MNVIRGFATPMLIVTIHRDFSGQDFHNKRLPVHSRLFKLLNGFCLPMKYLFIVVFARMDFLVMAGKSVSERTSNN